MLEIERITMENPLYQQERALRNEVLLRPIGIPDFGWEKYDMDAVHFIAKENKKVIGCVVLYPQKEQQRRAQLMQMAVSPSHQRNGIGKNLIEDLLQYCSLNEISEVFCHSRADVVHFYQNNGFSLQGEAFEEVGIVHFNMNIQL